MILRRPLVDRVCGELRQIGAVAVVGPPGFGKSAVLDAVCADWEAAGEPVVRLSSAPADAQLVHAPLVDLLTACPAEVAGELSDLQRSAVDWVLRRAAGPEPDATTLRVTVLTCLQLWGRTARPLLAADELHWWGPGSLDVIRFAARRSRRSVSVLAALRPDGPAPHEVLGGGAVEIGIPALTPEESAALVRSRGLPMRTGARIHTATGGNPRLVSDIADGLVRAGRPAVALDVRPLAPHARKAVCAWLAEVAEPVRQVLLTAALAADPSLDTVRRAAGLPADTALETAEAAGLVRVVEGAVDFPAPVVREGLAARAGDEAVRRAHRMLAGASARPDDQAWHEASALAGAGLPAHLADALAAAAGSARERGDHARAAEFGLLAGDRSGGTRPDLLAAAARDAEAAGRLDLAWAALERLDRTRAAPAACARARIAVVDAAGRAGGLLPDLAAQALAEAAMGDEPGLAPAAQLSLARSVHLARGYGAEALAQAHRAVELAERSGEPAVHAAALALAARIEQGRGSPEAAATLGRALGPGAGYGAGRLADDPRRTAVRFALLDDRTIEAGRLLEELRPAIRRVGGPADLVWLLGSSVQVRARAGDGPGAREEAARMLELVRGLGASPGPSWYAAATAELAGGSLEQALGYAELGLTASQEEADPVVAARCLHLSGTTRLLLADSAGGLADLLQVQELVREAALRDPAVVRYEADLAEALIAAGDLDAAVRTVADARSRAEELRRRGVLAALDRAEALCRTAARAFGPAEELLVRAGGAFEQLRLPLEYGRVLLARAAVEQRRRRPARAREARAAAEAVFRTAGAPLWGPARPEREGAPSWLAGLTDAEQRVAELVVDGHGNRDIAAARYVSVKTVEAVLTRIYQKLEVRSRVQLVALARRDERHLDR